MMPRHNTDSMEGAYPGHASYGRQPPQGGGRGSGASSNPNSAAGGGGGGGSAGGGGMPPQGYEGDMRTAARYSMGPPGNMQHHHGMGPPNMDPVMGVGGMGGYHRGPHHDGMGGGMMAMQQQHGNFPGYPSQELSPNMSRMTAGNMYGMQGHPPQPQQPQRGNSPTSYGNTPVGSGGRGGGGNDSQSGSGMAEMGSTSERGGGASGSGPVGMPGAMPGPNAAGGAGSTSVSQAEREEELLLNLLIARRQRGRISGEHGQSRQEGYYADELLRLRQGRAAAAAAAAGQAGSRGGGALPPMPGMPPIYMDHPVNTLPAVSGQHFNVGIAGHAGGAYNDHFKSPSDVVAMNLPIQEGVDQRIDRSPPHLMDARTQDMMMMRDFSGRGMKRSPYEMVAGPPMHQAGMGPMKYHMGMQSMDMTGAGAGGPPAKKKRSHKKKPADMPRRPLSAYNLFFSEERERILKEIDGDSKGEEGEDKKDEEKTEEEKVSEAASEGGEGEESSKPKALLRPLIPNQKKRRPHRKTHGKISFQQLARMVGERWKALPDDRRKKYQELAQEDMKRQKQAMEEYYAKQQALKDGRGGDLYIKQQQQMEAHVPEGIPESSNI
mmetsp:Transcript_13321/g.25272  ORF Transcript_13321/g.25272 Transcript_13321/m.25272 type:complete len:605 (-) Transcript_13321:81-1895(-)